MSKMTKQVEEARGLLDQAVEALDEQDVRIQAMPDDAPDEERDFHKQLFETRKEDVARARETLERLIAIAHARQTIPPDQNEPDENDATEKRQRIQVKEKPTYHLRGQHSYFRDLYQAWKGGNAEAQARLEQHGREVLVEKRDVTTSATGAASFIPPIYLGDLWIDEEVAGRQFADAVPKFPFPESGSTLTFPRVATAPAAAVQAAEANAVNEVDLDGEDYTAAKVMIAGQNDTSLQTLLWSDPTIDVIIFRELQKSYNQQLDAQLIHGSGANGQHRGLRNVSSINTETFSSGGADDLLGKIYSAISQVATNAPGYEANAILLHPRRAAWMASHRDANGNLFQQGQLFLAAGGQDAGFVGNVAGLRTIRDSNIQVTIGSSTNEDEVYVIDVSQLLLAEGPVATRVLTEVLSGTLQVRFQVYGESIFAGGRRPKVITRISGAGLATPTFPST